MSDFDTDRWYLAYTQPQREALAEQELRNQDYRTFLPRYRKTVRHARKFRKILAPYFPRYVFVFLSSETVRWRSINGTRGVVRLVQFGETPQPVPDGIVEVLLARSDAAGILDATAGLKPGQEATVLSGPFSGLVGKLLSVGADNRVRVLLEIMGTARQVTLPVSDVTSMR